MVWTSKNGPKCPVSPEDRGEESVVQSYPETASTLLPCPLCQSGNVQLGACWIGERKLSEEPTARCMDCGCRATKAAWQARAVAQAGKEPTASELIAWFKSRPGISWEMTVRDIERAISALSSTYPRCTCATIVNPNIPHARSCPLSDYKS